MVSPGNKRVRKRTKRTTERKPVRRANKGTTRRAVKVIESELSDISHKLHRVNDLLDILPLGICLFNKEDVITYCNDSFTAITGIDKETVIGKRMRKNQLWGIRGQKDELKELFQQAKDNLNPLSMSGVSAASSKYGERLWNINLLPDKDKNGQYAGMSLIIEDVPVKTSAGEESLYNAIYSAAAREKEIQLLLDNVVSIIKEYTGYSNVKIIIEDRIRGHLYRADSEKRTGLWDTGKDLSHDQIEDIFKCAESLVDSNRTVAGSISLNNLSQIVDRLTGRLREIVKGLSDSYGFNAIAFIPIKQGDYIYGFIQIARISDDIEREKIEILEGVASQLQLILDHSWLKEELRIQRESLLRQMNERNAYLEALSERLKQEVSERTKAQEEIRLQCELANKLNEVDDLSDALKICLESAMRIAGMEKGAIFLVGDAEDRISVASDSGFSSGVAANIGQCYSSWDKARIVSSGSPVYLTSDEFDDEMGALLREEDIRSVGFIPIISDNKHVAILAVASNEENRAAYHSQYALEAVAAQIGSALVKIQNRQAYRESEERYRTLFTRTANPILVIDEDGNYIDGNDAALEFLECTREELLGMNVKDTLPPYLNEQWLDGYREVWKTGGRMECDYYVWGKIKVLDITITPLRYGDRQIVIGIGQDITERKRIEQALHESESKYRAVVENANEGIFVFQDGSFKYANDKLVSITQYSREELRGIDTGQLLKIFIHPDDLTMIENVYSKVLRGEEVPHIYDVRWFSRDGTMRWAAVNTTNFIWEGKPAALGFVTDVTEHRKIEEALKISEEKYRTVLEDMEEFYYELDPKGNFTFINDAAEKIFGYSVEELTGMNYKVYTPLNQRGERIKAFSEVFRTGKPAYSQPLEHIRKDGTRVIVEVSILPLRDDKGEIIGLRGVGRDVTAHIKAEEELKKRAFLLDSAYDSIIAFTLDGSIIYANESACTSRGYTREEMLNLNVRRLVADYNLIDFEKYLAEMDAQKELVYEIDHITKDNNIFSVEAYSRSIEEHGDKIIIAVFRDITQRKRVEQALKASEYRFRQLAEMLPLVVFEANKDGILTYVNRNGLNTFGYSEEEIVSDFSLFEVIDCDYHDLARSNIQSVLAGNKIEANEYRLIKKDGSKFTGLIYSDKIQKGEEVTGIRGVVVDISSIKEVEKNLRDSEEKYRSVVENAGEGIFVAQNGRLIYVNPRVIEIAGYSAQELESRPFIEFVYPDDRSLVEERYFARLQGEKLPEYYTFRIIHKHGDVKWVGLRATRIDWMGQPATLNFITDVTDIVKAENALKESEERYRLLADNLMDVIFTLDMDMKITYISPSVRYFIGRKADEIIKLHREGKLNAESLGLSDCDAERGLSGIRALMKDPSRTQVFEFEFRHRDGFTSWAEVKMSIMRDRAGQAGGVLGIVRDVTQQKKMTERLIRTDRLASLGEMAAGLAHEVNNPLTAVMGFAYLLQQNQNLPPDIKKDIDSIYNEGKRAAEVIKNFLIFARGHKSEKQAVFINDIIEAALRLRLSQMAKENITVELNLAEDLPAVYGDISQLQQVFLNIILNAEYFMYQTNKKGTLRITTAQEEDKVKIAIADDGPGIPQDKLGRIFDPFYTTKQVGEGTGMGLSICHGIVNDHGGVIYADSRQGEWTTFTVELPAIK